jgi:hypothetical protein
MGGGLQVGGGLGGEEIRHVDLKSIPARPLT